jgi:hypothetical protein
MDNFWLICICVGPIISIVMVLLIWLFFFKNAPYLPDLDETNTTDWRPSREIPNVYWRYNYINDLYQYCSHPIMEPYYDDEKCEVLKCQICGFTATLYKK